MCRNFSQICNIFKYCVDKFMFNNSVQQKTQSGAFSESTSFVNAIHRENYSTGTLADDCHGGMMLKIEIFVVFCVFPLTCGKNYYCFTLKRSTTQTAHPRINVYLRSDSNKEKRKLHWHCQWWWHCIVYKIVFKFVLFYGLILRDIKTYTQ